MHRTFLEYVAVTSVLNLWNYNVIDRTKFHSLKNFIFENFLWHFQFSVHRSNNFVPYIVYVCINEFLDLGTIDPYFQEIFLSTFCCYCLCTYLYNTKIGIINVIFKKIFTILAFKRLLLSDMNNARKSVNLIKNKISYYKFAFHEQCPESLCTLLIKNRISQQGLRKVLKSRGAKPKIRGQKPDFGQNLSTIAD